jgi:hypothetical protein
LTGGGGFSGAGALPFGSGLAGFVFAAFGRAFTVGFAAFFFTLFAFAGFFFMVAIASLLARSRRHQGATGVRDHVGGGALFLRGDVPRRLGAGHRDDPPRVTGNPEECIT